MKQVTCFPDKQLGSFHPQHGMCNWLKLQPTVEGSVDQEQYKAVSELMQQINPPLNRLKYFYGRGYGKCIDVPFIFIDPSKNANDPNNYYFSITDKIMREVFDMGKPIIYHLGPMRENWSVLYTKMPVDYEKFAQVCFNIVRHINDGWANGMHCGVEYWEIWNRADDPHCWAEGTYKDYYRLYETVARKIKNVYPDLKVGGPATANVGDPTFLQGFLDYVCDNHVPCDFVSWHYYGTDPSEAGRQAKLVKKMVKNAGLNVPVFNDEWNALELDVQGIIQCPNARNMVGAAFDAAFMIQMESAGMDLCTYYDALSSTPWGAMYDTCGYRTHKPIYSFVAFSKLYALRNRIAVKTTGKNVYALAAYNNGHFALLVSVCQSKKDTLKLDIPFRGRKCIRLLDETHDFDVIEETDVQQLNMQLHGHSVVFVESM